MDTTMDASEHITNDTPWLTIEQARLVAQCGAKLLAGAVVGLVRIRDTYALHELVDVAEKRQGGAE